MNHHAQARILSARLAAAMEQPPHPVVQQYGFYAFVVDGRYPTAVSVPGGTVYAKDFKEWVGRELPETAVVDFRELEPSPVALVAMLEGQKR